MYRFKLGRKGRKTVNIGRNMHTVVALYAKKKDISITEAIHNLLVSGIANLLGYKYKD